MLSIRTRTALRTTCLTCGAYTYLGVDGRCTTFIRGLHVSSLPSSCFSFSFSSFFGCTSDIRPWNTLLVIFGLQVIGLVYI